MAWLHAFGAGFWHSAAMDSPQKSPFGTMPPDRFDRAVLAATARLPAGWLGLKLSVLLRRLVTMRPRAHAFDVERFGMRMRLYPRDSICDKLALFTPQMFDPQERAELAAEIDRVASGGETFNFVDIGANVGLISLFVASRAGKRARIIAVEPEAGIFARLCFNLAANPGVPVEPFRLALAEDAGEMAIEIDRRNLGGTRTLRLSDVNAALPRVPCRSLLQLLRDAGLDRVDALKIDVEGMEEAILMPFFRDAPRPLWPRLVVIENAPERWSVDVIDALIDHGYTVSSRTPTNAMLRIHPDAETDSATGSATSIPAHVIRQR